MQRTLTIVVLLLAVAFPIAMQAIDHIVNSACAICDRVFSMEPEMYKHKWSYSRDQIS